MKFSGLDKLALVLLIIGGLNWGLVGLWDMNLVMKVFGSGTLTAVIYDLVGLAGLYALFTCSKWGRKG